MFLRSLISFAEDTKECVASFIPHVKARDQSSPDRSLVQMNACVFSCSHGRPSIEIVTLIYSLFNIIATAILPFLQRSACVCY